MKLYRNHHGTDEDGSAYYSWHATQQAAIDNAAKEDDCAGWYHGSIAEKFECKLTEYGLLRFLNNHTSYPNNG